MRLSSGLDGLGLTYLPEDHVLPYIAEGRLIRVLEDWCPCFPGYHLYYPNRRHTSPPFSVLVDTLRYRDSLYRLALTPLQPLQRVIRQEHEETGDRHAVNEKPCH